MLAAGQSQRFGGDKLLHPLAGKPLAAYIAETLAGMDFGHRLAICSVGEERKKLFAAQDFRIVENADPGRGMASSLALGAQRALELGADRMMVCCADMPFVTAAHLSALMAVEGDVVATEVDGVRSPPAVFAQVMFSELATLAGDQGARRLIRSAVVIQATQAMVRDFDVRSDFGQAG